MTADDVAYIAATAVVRPGDVLLVAVPNGTTLEIAERLRDGLMAELPGLAGVMILSGISDVAAYRADDA